MMFLNDQSQLLNNKYMQLIMNVEKNKNLLKHGIELLSISSEQKVFYYYTDPIIPHSIIESFPESSFEKKTLTEIISEWNSRICISEISKKWKKERPTQNKSDEANLLILLFNVECLNTHLDDVDVLLTEHKPHICILTGVGTASRKLPSFPEYTGLSKEATNSFGGAAILLYKSILKCKIKEKELNFLLIELEMISESILLGTIYVPPGTLPPFQLLNTCKDTPFYIFGDFNAKHTTWGCNNSNTSGTHIFD